ncbi:MAG: hypothetical protein HY650_05870 [Acidobacteria bacterium]|nr:hypothetical protein [Acidobacteriota bacterium]
MVGAWNKYRPLLKYADRSKYPPEEVALVPLAEHTISSEHHPYVEIMWGEQSLGKLEFGIELEITLEGIVLKNQDGKIKEIKTGTCKVKGTVKYADLVILEKDSEEISLPGPIDLGEGVAIKPL